MEPHGQSPWYLCLPRLVRYGEILFDNFAILVGLSANRLPEALPIGEHLAEAEKLFRIHPRAKPVVFCEGG